MPRRKKPTPPPYEPSQALQAAFAELADAETAHETARQAARKAVADDMRATEQPQAAIVECIPWGDETVREIAIEYGIPSRTPGLGATPMPPYEPSQTVKKAFKALSIAEKQLKLVRQATRKLAADELRASGLSRAKFAKHTPWSDQTIRLIAIEYGVPGLRQSTVRSIKD